MVLCWFWALYTCTTLNCWQGVRDDYACTTKTKYIRKGPCVVIH